MLPAGRDRRLFAFCGEHHAVLGAHGHQGDHGQCICRPAVHPACKGVFRREDGALPGRTHAAGKGPRLRAHRYPGDEFRTDPAGSGHLRRKGRQQLHYGWFRRCDRAQALLQKGGAAGRVSGMRVGVRSGERLSPGAGLRLGLYGAGYAQGRQQLRLKGKDGKAPQQARGLSEGQRADRRFSEHHRRHVPVFSVSGRADDKGEPEQSQPHRQLRKRQRG